MSVHEIMLNARVSLSLSDASDVNLNDVAVQLNHSFTQLQVSSTLELIVIYHFGFFIAWKLTCKHENFNIDIVQHRWANVTAKGTTSRTDHYKTIDSVAQMKKPFQPQHHLNLSIYQKKQQEQLYKETFDTQVPSINGETIKVIDI